MRKRSGYSLVECLAAMSLIAATLATIAVAMHGMRRSCQRVGEESAADLDMERLAAQLRSDAHRARSVVIEPPADPDMPAHTLVLTLADNRTVQYTLATARLDRRVHQDGEVRHRESYRLPRSFTAQWQVDPARYRPMASLMVVPGRMESGSTLGFDPIRIDAAVGLLGPPTPSES